MMMKLTPSRLAARFAGTLILTLGVVAASCSEDAAEPRADGAGSSGSVAVGGACQADADCRFNICSGGVCQMPCSEDLDCASGSSCSETLGYCESSAGSCRAPSDCGPTETCDRGECVALPDGDCTPASIRCVGDAAVVCSPAGEVVSTTECAPEGICVEEEGVARCADVLCEPGSSRCFGAGSVKTCSADGQDEAVESCAAGTTCVDAECVQSVCTPNQLRCDGDDLIGCDFRGQSERLIVTCEEGCQNNECVFTGLPPCREGAKLSCYGGPEPRSSLGACNFGEQVCTGGEWGECEGWTSPAEDSCEPTLDCSSELPMTAVVTNDIGSQLVSWLRARGWTVTSVSSLEDSHLESASLVMGVTLTTSLSAINIRQFLEDGGAFMMFGTASPSVDCALMNPSLSMLDFHFSCSKQVLGGDVMLRSHDAVAGLRAGDIPHTAATEIELVSGGSAEAIVRAGGNPIAVAAPVGCGRAVIWGDIELIQDQTWDVAELIWARILPWISASN